VAKPDVLRQIKREPAFWNVTAHALQTTFIITIGRVFDEAPRSHSIQKLLAEMATHAEYFSKQALERRRGADTSGGDASWLPDYLRDAWEPTTADLEKVRDTLNPTVAKYQQVYQTIRHKMFAHKDIAVGTNAQLGKTLIGDVEQILYALRDMLEAVWQLYTNGRKPTLGKQKYDDEDRVRETS
jgi:hypothetical protein